VSERLEAMVEALFRKVSERGADDFVREWPKRSAGNIIPMQTNADRTDTERLDFIEKHMKSGIRVGKDGAIGVRLKDGASVGVIGNRPTLRAAIDYTMDNAASTKSE
jgi:hypothetical protein